MIKRIVIEGADGAGKTSVAKMLVERLLGHEEVVTRREPGGTVIGEKMRNEIIYSDGASKCHLSRKLAYILSHAELTYELKDIGATIVLDRYSPISNIVYERYGEERDISYMIPVYKEAMKAWRPEIVFILTPSPACTHEIIKRSMRDRVNTNADDFLPPEQKIRTMVGYRDCDWNVVYPGAFQSVYILMDEHTTTEEIVETILRKIRPSRYCDGE
jgi:dTMP kinase